GIARLPPWLGRASFFALAVLVLVATVEAWRTPFPNGSRKAINDAVTREPGPHLVLVPRDCCCLVYNGADVDRQRVVWARELGAPEVVPDVRLVGHQRRHRAVVEAHVAERDRHLRVGLDGLAGGEVLNGRRVQQRVGHRQRTTDGQDGDERQSPRFLTPQP